ncbi:MAG TPA: hypothetical protein VNO51_02210 [Ilumatobacteraceae bacterium]|nr:hypothetical protein [Ilumatobacteraceae bacterium]
MTRPARWTDENQVGDALGVVFSAVDAALRSDPDVEARLDALHRWADMQQLLVAISIATLDQLGDGIDAAAPSSGALAAALLDRAVQFDLSPPSAVHAAAGRLEVVGRHERWLLTAELRCSRTAASDDGLVDGAIALLAATVELAARRRGQSPELIAERLCLAASSRQRTCTPSPSNAGA